MCNSMQISFLPLPWTSWTCVSARPSDQLNFLVLRVGCIAVKDNLPLDGKPFTTSRKNHGLWNI